MPFTNEQKIKMINWWYEGKSITRVQRRFQAVFKEPAPSRKTIYNLVEKFETTGSVCNLYKNSGRPKLSDSDE